MTSESQSQFRLLESFLEQAFGSIAPLFTAKSHVTVTPYYSTIANPSDRSELTQELVRCLRDHPPGSDAFRSPQGCDIEISGVYPLLKKYLRRITLRKDSRIGAWIRVLPSGEPF
jgi:hypothetical protein